MSFAFDYDVNNIIKDLPREKLVRLWKEREVKWGAYRLEWMPRKWFQVSEVNRETNRTIKGTSVRIYDIYGFFQSGFVKACEDWLGKRDPDLRIVRKWKRRRPTFKPEDLPSLREYNAAELRLMVRLAQALKAAFDAAGIPLTQYYGPGASATTYLGQIGAKAFIDRHQPVEVETAGRHAYIGGRIEVPVYGEIPGPLYRYDLNSAYPSAIVDLPNLTNGRWIQDKVYRADLPYSVYHISWKLPGGRPFYPFPWRSPEGGIFFPPTGRAWVWHPELTAAIDKGGFSKRAIRILEAWHFIPDDSTERPFRKVAETYAWRKKLQGENDPAERAIKLCLNSLYGKLAQSVSAAGKFGATDGHARKPTYHQIEHAGYVASVCRARVYRAAMQKPEAIVAFATDGILSREPLDLSTSEELGEWSAEEFHRATVVQSGVYRLQLANGKWETHGRGFAEKNLPWGRIRRGWMQGVRKLNATGRRKRFIGLGAAIQWDAWDRWRSFERIPRNVQLSAVGKRIDQHPVPGWTPEHNPATKPHRTDAYDPVRLEGYDPESTPWRPKWEDPGAETVEDWELTFEGRTARVLH
ncbi:MAG TPA: DNA polymerase [Thermoplasmata archaeon]|nr:DNA polymerase [Thermoplasmata archaeon]